MDSFLGIPLPDVARQILSVVSSGSNRHPHQDASTPSDSTPRTVPVSSAGVAEGASVGDKSLQISRRLDDSSMPGSTVTLGMKMMNEMLAEEEATAQGSPARHRRLHGRPRGVASSANDHHSTGKGAPAQHRDSIAHRPSGDSAGARAAPEAASQPMDAIADAESVGTYFAPSIASAGAVLVTKPRHCGGTLASVAVDSLQRTDASIAVKADVLVKPRSRAGRETSAHGWMTSSVLSSGRISALARSGATWESPHARRRRRRSSRLPRGSALGPIRSSGLAAFAWSDARPESAREVARTGGGMVARAAVAAALPAVASHGAARVRSEGQASDRADFSRVAGASAVRGPVRNGTESRNAIDSPLWSSRAAQLAQAMHRRRLCLLPTADEAAETDRGAAASSGGSGRRPGTQLLLRTTRDGTLAPCPESEGRRRASVFTGEGGRAEENGRRRLERSGSERSQMSDGPRGSAALPAGSEALLAAEVHQRAGARPSSLVRRQSEPADASPSHRKRHSASWDTWTGKPSGEPTSGLPERVHGRLSRSSRRPLRAGGRAAGGSSAADSSLPLAGRGRQAGGKGIRAASYASSTASSLAAVGLLDRPPSPTHTEPTSIASELGAMALAALAGDGRIPAPAAKEGAALVCSRPGSAQQRPREQEDGAGAEAGATGRRLSWQAESVADDAAALFAASQLFAQAAAAVSAAELAGGRDSGPHRSSRRGSELDVTEERVAAVAATSNPDEQSPPAMTVVRVHNGWGEESVEPPDMEGSPPVLESSVPVLADGEAAVAEILEGDGRESPQSVPVSPRASVAALRHMALFSEETVTRARDALVGLRAAEELGPTGGGPGQPGCSGEDAAQEQARAEQAALRAAVAASSSSFHPAFTHPRLSLLAAGHAVWWPSRSARVRRLLYHQSGRSGSEDGAEDSAALAWAAPGEEGRRGAARSSSDEVPAAEAAATPAEASSAGEGSATEGSTPALVDGPRSAERVASARAALPVGLGAIASVGMLGEWCASADRSLERRVHCGLSSDPHLAAFLLEPSAPTAGERPRPCGESSALPEPAPAAGVGARAVPFPPMGVGLVCLPATDLADAGTAMLVASRFASSRIGSAAKSIAFYSDGSIMCGGVVLSRPKVVSLCGDAEEAVDFTPRLVVGDAVTMILVPHERQPGSVTLEAGFVHHRLRLLVFAGQIQVTHSELVFAAVTLEPAPRRMRLAVPAGGCASDAGRTTTGGDAGGREHDSVRVRAVFSEHELLDAGVIEGRCGDLNACAEVAAGLRVLVRGQQVFGKLWTLNGSAVGLDGATS